MGGARGAHGERGAPHPLPPGCFCEGRCAWGRTGPHGAAGDPAAPASFWGGPPQPSPEGGSLRLPDWPTVLVLVGTSSALILGSPPPLPALGLPSPRRSSWGAPALPPARGGALPSPAPRCHPAGEGGSSGTKAPSAPGFELLLAPDKKHKGTLAPRPDPRTRLSSPVGVLSASGTLQPPSPCSQRSGTLAKSAGG